MAIHDAIGIIYFFVLSSTKMVALYDILNSTNWFHNLYCCIKTNYSIICTLNFYMSLHSNINASQTIHDTIHFSWCLQHIRNVFFIIDLSVGWTLGFCHSKHLHLQSLHWPLPGTLLLLLRQVLAQFISPVPAFDWPVMTFQLFVLLSEILDALQQSTCWPDSLHLWQIPMNFGLCFIYPRPVVHQKAERDIIKEGCLHF